MNRQHRVLKGERPAGLAGLTLTTFHCCNKHCDHNNLQKEAFGFSVKKP